MRNNWTFRVSGEGVSQLERDMRKLGETGKRALEAIKASAPGLGKALDEAAAKATRAREELERFRTANSASSVNARLGVSDDFGGAAKAADVAAYGQELDRLRARFSPLFAAQQAYRREIGELNRALKVGAISQAEFGAALGRTKAAFAQQVTALNTVDRQIGRNVSGFRRYGAQIQQAGYQVGDFAVQVASGQNALVAFTQQGSQLLQVFGGPWGAVLGAALSIVGALALGFFKLSDAAAAAAEAQKAYTDAVDGAKDLLRTSKENAEARAEAELKVAKAKLAVVIATQQEIAAEAQAQATRLDGVTAGRAIGRDPRADQSKFQQQADQAIAKIREAQTLLDKLNQPGALGTAREAALDSAKEQADAFARLLDSLDRDRAQAAEQFAASFDGLLDKIDPVAAATRALARDQKLLAEGYIEGRFGIVGSTEALAAYARALDQVGAAYKDKLDPVAAALEKLNAEQVKQNAALSAERTAISQTDVQRARANATLEAENKLRAENIDLSDPRAQAYIAEAQALAEREVRQKRAIDQMEAGQQELERFLDQSWDRIGGAITGALATGEIKFASLVNIGRAAASELLQLFAKLALINPLKNLATGGTLPTLGSMLGGTGAGVTGGGGASAGGLGNLGSALQFGGILGNGGGIGSFLWGTPATLAAGGSGPSSVIASTSGILGSGGGGQLGALLNTPVGGGIASSLLAFGASVLSGQGMLQSGITAGLTGIGTALGGPIGGVVGGMLGSVLGGLLGKKKPKLKKNEAEAWLEAGPYGYPVVDYTDTDGKVPGGMGGDLGKAARAAVTEALAGAGATLDDATRLRLSYYHSTKGGKTKSEFYKATMFADLSSLGLKNISGEIARYSSVEEALAALSAGALFSSGLQGRIAGTGASTQAAFRYLYTGGGKTKGSMANVPTDVAEVMEVVNFTKWIDGFDKVRTAGDASRKALDDLNASLAKLNSKAEELGIDLDKVTEATRRDFAESVQGELLQLTDPQKFALQELEKEYAGRRAVAEKLGLDLVDLEKLYAIRRQQILDQGLKGVADTWRDFINQLQFGDASALSPATQLDNARAQYEASKGAGGQAFREAATTYLGLLRGTYGSTEGYTSVFAEVLALSKQFGGISGIPGFAAGGDHPGGLRLVGEQGAEIEATGPARYFSASQTAEILRQAAASGRSRMPGWYEKGAPRQLAGDGGFGARPANDDHVATRLAPQFAALSFAIDRLSAAQERSNREARLMRETMRQK